MVVKTYAIEFWLSAVNGKQINNELNKCQGLFSRTSCFHYLKLEALQLSSVTVVLSIGFKKLFYFRMEYYTMIE